MADIQFKVGADASEMQATLTKVAKDVHKMSTSVKSQVADIGMAFMGIKSMVETAFSGVYKVVSGVFDVGMPTAAIQKIKLQIEGLTGSAEEAARVIKQVNDFGLQSTYTPTNLFANARDLIKSGIGSSFAPELLQQLSVIAQGDQAKLDTLVAAMAKGNSGVKGFSSRILEVFSAQGIDIQTALEKVTDLQGQALKDFASKGISLDVMAGAINELSKDGSALSQAYEKYEGSWEGLLKQFENSTGNLIESFGVGLIEPMSRVMESVTDFLLQNETTAVKWGQAAGEAFKSLTEIVTEFGTEAIRVWNFLSDHGTIVTRVIFGLIAAFVAMKSGIAQAAAASAGLFKGMQGEVATLSTKFTQLWTNFKLQGQLAWATVKTAAVASGIGALVVGLTEGITWAIKAMNGVKDDDGPGGISGGADRAADKRMSQKIANENATYSKEMSGAKSGIEIEAIGNRLQDEIKKAKEDYAAIQAGLDGAPTKESQLQGKYLKHLEQQYETYLSEKDNAISSIRERNAAFEREKALLKKQEEIDKQIAKNKEDYAKMQEQWAKKQAEIAFGKQSLSDKNATLDFNATRVGASPGLDGVNARIAELAAGPMDDATMQKINFLNELREKYIEVADARKKLNETKDGWMAEMNIRKAQLTGNKELAQSLKDELEIRKKISDFMAQGMSEGEATSMANKEVGLSRIEEQGKKGGQEKIGLSSIIAQSGVDVGNGGRSLGITNAQITEAKRQSSYLSNIENLLKKWKPGSIVLVD